MLRTAILGVLALLSSAASGQWDPSNGDWTKSDATDIRVMTYNIEDGICRTCPKVNGPGFAGNNAWNALAMTVAALQPDILLLQEAGDNSGGSGSGADSVSQLETTLELWMHGGTDPFLGGTVTAYVQLYAPSYDLPFIYVSPVTDNFNRNVIMSRYPFADLNGDGLATKPDIDVVPANEYAIGGNGGIRGIQVAEIDLPDAIYEGNFIAMGAHLKSGGSSSDRDQRERAASNAAYWIWNVYYGRGMGSPDPNNVISDFPPAQALPCPFTPVVFGGDLNEDEGSNGRFGPALFISSGGQVGGVDGVDLDNSDGVIAPATDINNGSDNTLGGSTLDYIIYPDSITTARRQFIFNTGTTPASELPAFFANLPFGATAVTVVAADHRPVIADFIVTLAGEGDCASPIGPGPFDLVTPADGSQTFPGFVGFTWDTATGATSYTFRVATDMAMSNVVIEQTGLGSTGTSIMTTDLPGCGTYFWDVTAVSAGETMSSNGPLSFEAPLPADINDAGSPSPAFPLFGFPDGLLTPTDFSAFSFFFSTGDLRADLNDAASPSPAFPNFGQPDGILTPTDFSAFSIYFANGCI